MQHPLDLHARHTIESGDNTFTRQADPLSYRQWHIPPLTANNDNYPIMVGITGLRNVGKSTFADVLEEEFGFNRIHAYEAGKHAAETYFRHVLRHLPDGDDLARRMVWGDLKDKPSPHLPDCASPRHFMERTGHFHGADMGTEWTLGLEIKSAVAIHPRAPIVVESVVYESTWFRSKGGKVIRLVRPDFDSPVGVKSDDAQDALTVDFEFTCRSIDEVEHAARLFVRRFSK